MFGLVLVEFSLSKRLGRSQKFHNTSGDISSSNQIINQRHESFCYFDNKLNINYVVCAYHGNIRLLTSQLLAHAQRYSKCKRKHAKLYNYLLSSRNRLFDELNITVASYYFFK